VRGSLRVNLAIDSGGKLYIFDYINNRIRRVDALTHAINTVAVKWKTWQGQTPPCENNADTRLRKGSF
jgi:hypothetical protein